jgi:hypothetical protein
MPMPVIPASSPELSAVVAVPVLAILVNVPDNTEKL